MRRNILFALLIGLLLAADASPGGPAKKTADEGYAKVELKGRLASAPGFHPKDQIPVLEVILYASKTGSSSKV